MSRHPAPSLPAEQLSAVWQSASLLLGYPDEPLLAELPLVRRAAGSLPAHVAEPLLRVVEQLEATPLPELQVDYVDTFDNRRRCNLYLTYFTHGDTRKRGLALLRFKQTYLRSGFVLDASPAEGEELPDHLCVVLEYAECAPLPKDRPQEQDRIPTLVAEGPPAAELGLSPYGEPEFDPLIAERSARSVPTGSTAAGIGASR